MLEWVHWRAVTPDLEVQLRLPLRPDPHLRDRLPALYRIALFDDYPIVVAVGTEVGIVVLNDQ